MPDRRSALLRFLTVALALGLSSFTVAAACPAIAAAPASFANPCSAGHEVPPQQCFKLCGTVCQAIAPHTAHETAISSIAATPFWTVASIVPIVQPGPDPPPPRA